MVKRWRLIAIVVASVVALALIAVAANAIFTVLIGIGYAQKHGGIWHESVFAFWQKMQAKGYSPLLSLWTYRDDLAFDKYAYNALLLAVCGVASLGLLIIYPFIRTTSRLTRNLWTGEYQTRPFVRGATDNHGHGTFMLPREALKIFSAVPRADGITKVIGRLPDGTTLYDNLNSGNTGLTLEFSGSGTGKTSSLVTQLAAFHGPRVVLDPSCEIAPMMWRYLTGLGQRVHIVSPDQSPVDPAGNPTAWAHLVGRYNPLDWVDISRPFASSHVRTFARFFFDDAISAGDNAYFVKAARSLVAIILGHILWSDGPDAPPKTLATLREILSLGAEQLEKYLVGVQRTSNCRMARMAVGPLLNSSQQAGRTFASVWDEANQATMWLTDPDLSYMVSGSDFRTTDICQKQAVSIFFTLPLDLLQTNESLGRVLLGSFVSAKIASGSTNWALIAPDEPWSVGRAPWMKIVIAAGRKHGLAMHAPWLDVGTLERTWGGKTERSFWFSSARCIMISRLNDPAVAREVSEACGQHGVLAWSEGKNKSVSIGTGWGRGSRGTAENLHEIKRDVLMPYEVIQDLGRDDLLVLGLGKPLMLKRATYWKYPKLKHGIEPTPFKEIAA